MVSFRWILTCGIICLLICLSCLAEEFTVLPPPPPAMTGGFTNHVEPVEGGKLDWTDGFILAEGIGKAADRSSQQRAMAERAAEMAAARNALAMTQGIRIDATGRISDLRDGVIRVEGVLKGYQIVSTTWQPKSRPPQCKVTLRVPIWGARSLTSVILPIHNVRQAEKPVPRLSLTPQRANVSDFVLVIDARGHKLAPCLFPAVVTKQGQVLYDVASLPTGMESRAPAVRYVETRERFEDLRAMIEDPDMEEYQLAAYNSQAPTSQASGSPASSPATTQAGDPPRQRAKRRMAVRVAEITGQQKTQLVLTQEDAKLRNSPQAAGAMRNAQVLIVVDAAAAGVEGRGPDPLQESLAASPRP